MQIMCYTSYFTFRMSFTYSLIILYKYTTISIISTPNVRSLSSAPNTFFSLYSSVFTCTVHACECVHSHKCQSENCKSRSITLFLLSLRQGLSLLPTPESPDANSTPSRGEQQLCHPVREELYLHFIHKKSRSQRGQAIYPTLHP